MHQASRLNNTLVAAVTFPNACFDMPGVTRDAVEDLLGEEVSDRWRTVAEVMAQALVVEHRREKRERGEVETELLADPERMGEDENEEEWEDNRSQNADDDEEMAEAGEVERGLGVKDNPNTKQVQEQLEVGSEKEAKEGLASSEEKSVDGTKAAFGDEALVESRGEDCAESSDGQE